MSESTFKFHLGISSLNFSDWPDSSKRRRKIKENEKRKIENRKEKKRKIFVLPPTFEKSIVSNPLKIPILK